MVKQLAEQYDFPFVIMRLPTVYGPGQPEHHTYQQVISIEDEDQERSESISKDSITEDVLFVDDAAEALYLAGKSPAKNEIYNISSGNPNQWLEGLTELKADKLSFKEKER